MKKTVLGIGGIGRRSWLRRGVSLALAFIVLFCTTFVNVPEKVRAATASDYDSYVRNKIYYGINGDYVLNGTSGSEELQVHVGDMIEVMAVFENPDVDDGTKLPTYDSEENQGSIFWAWAGGSLSRQSMVWDQIEGTNDWVGRASFKADKIGGNDIYLALRSGNAPKEYQDTLYVDVVESAIPVDAFEHLGEFYIKTDSGYQSKTALGNAKNNAYQINANDEIEVGILVNIVDVNIQFNHFFYTDPSSDWQGDQEGENVITSAPLSYENTSDNQYVWITRTVKANGVGYGVLALDASSESYKYNNVYFEVIDPTEPEVIYYRVNGQGDYVKNETSDGNRLLLKEGDVIEVFALQGSRGAIMFSIFDNDSGRLTREKADEGESRVDATFKATQVTGGCRIVLLERGAYGSDPYNALYVSVVPRTSSTEIAIPDGEKRHTYHFYVDTALGERSKDQVHEYLGNLGIDGTNDGKYVKNDNVNYRDNYSCRYWLNPDDVTSVVLYVPAGENGEFTSSNVNNLQIEGAVWGTAFEGGDGNLYQRVEVKLKAGDNSTHMRGVTLSYQVNGIVCEEMYFDVIDGDEFMWQWPNFSWANHLDIEVADGGQYIDKTIIYLADGTRLEILTEYEVEVGGVNLCSIAYEAGESVASGAITKIAPEEYGWHEDDSTGGQREYTSAFRANADEEKRKDYPQHQQGVYNDWRDNGEASGEFVTRNIPRSRIDSVVFDVKLDLIEKKQTITWYKDGAQGSLEGTTEGDAYADRYVKTPDFDSIKFEMKGQSLIDALNKCPNHSGLDFTLTKYVNQVVTEVNLPVQKIFVGGDLSKNHSFQFELLDANGERFYEDKNGNGVKDSGEEIVISVVVDEYGAASFDDTHALIDFLNFTENDVGRTFTYYVKEIIPEGDTSAIVYDDGRIRVDVKIVKVRNEELNIDVLDAEIYFNKMKFVNNEWIADGEYTQPNAAQFTNYAKYKLPDSGGGGVFPYVFGGGLLMTIAVILLYLHKRRAVKLYATYRIKY